MKYPTDRRTVLATAGAAALAAAAGPSAGQTTEIRGAVSFEGGGAIPRGHLEIYLEDPAVRDDASRRVGATSIESDGRTRSLNFTLSLATDSQASSTLRIVARLERANGWLIARGSAPYETGSTTEVTLSEVMY